MAFGQKEESNEPKNTSLPYNYSPTDMKPIQYTNLVGYEILTTKDRIDESGEKAERAVRTFRALLAVKVDQEYLHGYEENGEKFRGWLERKKEIDRVHSDHDKDSSTIALNKRLQPLLLEEYEALLALAYRRRLLGIGGAMREID